MSWHKARTVTLTVFLPEKKILVQSKVRGEAWWCWHDCIIHVILEQETENNLRK
jgi:hypothetical protein